MSKQDWRCRQHHWDRNGYSGITGFKGEAACSQCGIVGTELHEEREVIAARRKACHHKWLNSVWCSFCRMRIEDFEAEFYSDLGEEIEAPTDVERNVAMQAELNAKSQDQLDREWREARDAEVHDAFVVFQEMYQIAQHDALPGELQPEDHIGTPARLARLLEERTGLKGWIVELREWNFLVNPPLRLAKHGITTYESERND